MDLSKVSDKELLCNLEKLSGTEREVTLKVLYHLIELDRRGIFRVEGYSSLFDYCVRKLRYSEGSANRRIQAARSLKEHTELGELYLKGEVSLCTISTASESIKRKTTEVSEIVGKSKREVEKLLAIKNPIAIKPKEKIKPLVITPVESPLFKLEPLERYEIRFSVSKEVFKEFEEAKAKLSHKIGKSLSVEAVFSRLIKSYLGPKRRKARGNPNKRYIPRAIKEELHKRDRGQCTFVSENGNRCQATHYLHIDHIQPFSMGGKTELSNLRLLCPAHNKLHAERCFGKDHIEKHFTATGGGRAINIEV